MELYKSKEHVIRAFQFILNQSDFPDWFTLAMRENRVSKTVGYKDLNYITIYNKDQSYLKAVLGDWVCINDQGTIFKLTNDEFNAGFYEINDL